MTQTCQGQRQTFGETYSEETRSSHPQTKSQLVKSAIRIFFESPSLGPLIDHQWSAAISHAKPIESPLLLNNLSEQQP